MKTLFTFLSYLFFCFNCIAQNIDGYVVTNSNDTIKCEIIVQRNIFNNVFYPSSINKKVKIINSEGSKLVYKPTNLKKVCLNENGKKYNFVSLKQDLDHFFQEIIIGKISYFAYYQDNYQGGYPIEIPFILKDEKLKCIKGIINFRSKLGEFLIDYPELYSKWMDSNNYYKINQAIDVINLYNEHFKNK